MISGSFEALDYCGPQIEKCYRLIISHILKLDRYSDLKGKILDLLQHPELQVLNRCHPGMMEQLFQAGFIASPTEFQNYLTAISNRDYPISFLTAPGSRMTDHHSYPGAGISYCCRY